jgi:tetratricopeptide (TPR) repeat protein
MTFEPGRVELPTSTLVGHQREQAQASAALRASIHGRGGCIVIAGEAGIGKTRMLSELATEARRLGAVAVWGRSMESGGAPPFWLWTQALRSAVDSLPAAADRLGHAAPLLDPPTVGDTGGLRDRTLLFDGVTRFLRALAAARPLMLLFDDLHAADSDSIALLRFVLRQLREEPLCIGAALRMSEDAVRHVGDLGRETLHLRLLGLNREETATLVNQSLAEMQAPVDFTAIPSEFLDGLHATTAGNPFFIREIVRELVLTGSSFRFSRGEELRMVPVQVREVIRVQLRMLSEPTSRLLLVAAVAGRSFDLHVVRAALALDRADADWLFSLDDARQRGLLSSTAEGGSRMAFSHALVRETIYEACTALERGRLHARIAAAIETLHPSTSHEHIAQIAHHRLRASAVGEAEAAIRACVTAARSSEALAAYGEAVGYWQAALELMSAERVPGAAPAADERQRSELLTGLGRTLNLAGDRKRAREVLDAAIEAARGARDPEGFARSVIAYGGETLGTMEVAKANAGPGAVFDDQLAGLLREALAWLGDRHHGLQARLLSRLAVEIYFSSPESDRSAMIERALEMAREGPPSIGLGHVLCESLVAIWTPDTGKRRLHLAREAVSLGQRCADVAIEAAGRVFATNVALEIGDLHALQAEAAAMTRLAERCPLPLLSWQVLIHRGMRALLDGRHDEAEALASEAMQFGHDNATLAYMVQLMELRRQQRRVSELGESIGMFKAIADQFPTMLYIRASLAALLADVGDHEEARRQLDCTAVDGFSRLTRDITWVGALTRLSEVCIVLGDNERAETLYSLLTPYGDQFSLGTYGGVCWGSVARDLGNLACVLGRWEESERWFEMATRRVELLGAKWWLAQTHLDHAAMRCCRLERGAGSVADAEVAERCLASLHDIDSATWLANSRDTLAVRLAATAHASSGRMQIPTTPEAVGAAAVIFACEGEYWSFGYEGRTVRIRDGRGVRFLVTLLQHPGQEIHAAELVRLRQADVGAAGVACGELPAAGAEQDLGAMIDPRSKAQYKKRIRELRDEIEDAELRQDSSRAALVQEEIDAIAGELRRAIGLGGRDRRAGSVAERARVNVTRGVAAVMRRIGESHPGLAEHLRYEIRTGTFCSYRGPHGRSRAQSIQ